jgi:hypothetical protein
MACYIDACALTDSIFLSRAEMILMPSFKDETI